MSNYDDVLRQVLALPIADRIRLADKLWEETISTDDVPLLSDEMKEELRRREAEYLRNPSQTYSWDEVKEHVLLTHA